MQIGLDRDLLPLSSALVAGTLDAAQRTLLAKYEGFFSATSDDERLSILEELRGLDASPIWPFVASLFALVREDHDLCRTLLLDARRRGLGGFAKARAEVLFAGLERRAGRATLVGMLDGLDVTFAYPEAAAIVETGDIDPMVHHTNRIFQREPN
jgi:hypothetical protein